MSDENKTTKQLVAELLEMHQQIAELKKEKAGRLQENVALRELKVTLEDQLADRTTGLQAAIDQLRSEMSEHKQVKEEIKNFKYALDCSTDAIGMSTPEGTHFYQNMNFDKIFGVIGDDPPKTLYVDQNVGREVFQTIMGGDEWIGEVAMYGKDKEVLDIFLRAYAVKNDGKIVAIVGMHTDISERKQREEELREAHEHLSAMINALPDLLLEVDQEGFIYDCRTPYPDLLFAPPEFFLNKKVREAFPAEAAQIIMRSIAEAAETGQHRGATFFLKSSACLHWFELSIAIKGSKAPETQFVMLVRDITERKRAGEEKLALERQILHTQKLESLGVLAGGIAHDFNNLLMSILCNANLALGELSPMSPARENLREIEKASKRAAELAKQMLAYSGKGQFIVEPIDIRELVEEMAHLLEVSISKKAVLKYNFAQNLPTFNGDVTQIHQVIMNLIINASEAIGDKSGVIALSTGAMDCDRAYLDDVSELMQVSLNESLPEGVYTYFEVADTGCGMDAETIEKLFDPFFTTKFTGRGLGMSAVLGIVRGHKGVLKIYSEIGKGTTFKILFPANELPDNGFAVERKGEAEGIDWRGSGTVLIVDDEEAIRTVGKQMLERMGFSILTAPDGREALNVFREHADEIVCVLLDLTMPRMDGEEAFREMRRLRPNVSVILCSGYNQQDVTRRFAGKGPAGFIRKPYDMVSLREKLMEILRDTTSDK